MIDETSPCSLDRLLGGLRLCPLEGVLPNRADSFPRHPAELSFYFSIAWVVFMVPPEGWLPCFVTHRLRPGHTPQFSLSLSPSLPPSRVVLFEAGEGFFSLVVFVGFSCTQGTMKERVIVIKLWPALRHCTFSLFGGVPSLTAVHVVLMSAHSWKRG